MLSILFDGRKPSFWAIIGTLALAMNVGALYFQYGLHMEPCVKCIDLRISLYIVSILAFLTSASNVHRVYFYAFRILTMAALTYATYLAVDYYLDTISPNPFAVTCSIEPNLPNWLPLHQWIPDVFEAKGMCGETNWKLLGMGLVQWSAIGCISLTGYAVMGILELFMFFTHKDNN